jgi:NitT/TauT family transport system substrate-binding protein
MKGEREFASATPLRRRPSGPPSFIPVHWICLLLASLVLCCSGTAAVADELEMVRIGLTRNASTAAVLIAIDAGYFKMAGLDPKLVVLADDVAVSAAVVSGKADIGLAALSAAFFRDAAAHHLKIIASRSSDRTGFPMYALLVSQKAHAAGLSGVRGLVNARIGVAGADSSEYYGLYGIPSRFDLDPGSIKTIVLKSSEGELKALAHGDIDAALLPYSAAAGLAIKGRTVFRLSDFAQWQEGVVFANAGSIASRRSLIEGFMRAYQHGAADYAINFLNYDDGGDFIPGPQYDRYLDLIARQAKISPESLAKTKTYNDRRANLDVADIQRQVQFWKQHGKLGESISADDLMDLSFIGEEGAAH